MEGISIVRAALAEALRTYRQLRPQLFESLVELKRLPGGPWKISYGRNPSEGDLGIPPKSRIEAAINATLNLDRHPGLRFLNLAAAVTQRETFAPFRDFTIAEDDVPVAPGSAAAGIGLRIGLILESMLQAAKTCAMYAHQVREAARGGRIVSDVRPILALADQFPAFPYWPRFTSDKAIYDAAIAEEVPLLDVAALAIEMLKDATPAGGGGAPADTEKHVQPKHRGRPADTDPTADAKIFDAWDTKHFPTFNDLAKSLGIGIRDAKRAVDRHRHRRNRPAE